LSIAIDKIINGIIFILWWEKR